MLRSLPLLLLTSLALAQTPKIPKGPPLSSQLPASTQMEPGAPAVVPGAFTIAILPDTQFYSQLHPEIFHQQTQWLADNAAKYATRFIIQVGDVTETAVDAEWTVAQAALQRLEGKIPWSSAPGNHDYGGKLQIHTRRSGFSNWLPLSLFRAMPTFGGVYDQQPDKTENNWHQFTAAARQWLVIGLEYSPRADVLRWANDVITAHPGHGVIIFTHAYLDPKTNERIQPPASAAKAQADKPDLSQPEDLWLMASRHANVVMILSGHACYTNHRTSTAQTGQAVQEMVVDYQRDVNGGNGWLRLLQILPDGKTVRCQDYSPRLDQRCTMPDRTFDFQLAMPGK